MPATSTDSQRKEGRRSDSAPLRPHARGRVAADDQLSQTAGRAADDVISQRQLVLSQAYDRNPGRFVRTHPKPPAGPTAVWITPPPARAVSEQEQ